MSLHSDLKEWVSVYNEVIKVIMCLYYTDESKEYGQSEPQKKEKNRTQSWATNTAKKETLVFRMQKNGFFQCHKNGKYE